MQPRKKTVVVLKGYPRLSETFIAQELRGLERAGFALEIVALRHPTDKERHPVHGEIQAPVRYLPEYLHDEPTRVLRGLLRCIRRPGFFKVMQVFLADLRRDRTRNRGRRFGQALVLAAELPADAGWLHAHFIHTPASVTAYASLLTGIPWTCSAHAKDIWTTPDWELAAKLSAVRWVVTCTRTGYDQLRSLTPANERVHLSYHGLDLDRFGHFDGDQSRADGSSPAACVTIVSVGRAVAKKGYDVLLQAFSQLHGKLHFRFIHAGSGEELPALKALAAELGLDGVIDWKGALPQDAVLALYRQADIFALACRVADDGDRDGLPNVLVEASSQGLACLSTNIAGVPELITHGVDGMLSEADNPQDIAAMLALLIRDPGLRHRLGMAAERRVREHFDHRASIRQIAALFESEWGDSR